MIEVNDLNDPLIGDFLGLKDGNLSERQLMLVESPKAFDKLLKSDHEIVKILITSKTLKQYEGRLPDVKTYVLNQAKMEKIVGYKLHKGVMALVKRPAFIPLADLDNRIVLLNGVTSPENVGSIVRSCAAFNVNSLIFDQASCNPYIRRAIRVSTGNILRLKVAHCADVVRDLDALKKLGYTIISTANTEDATDLPNYRFPEKFVLVFGSEGHGVSPEVLGSSDVVLRIDVNPEVEHLNASVASAIALYQISLS